MAQTPMRIFCREDINLNVAIRGTTVVLARANPSDVLQHWVQDFSVSEVLTDDQGQRAFALVNQATGQAVNKDEPRPGDQLIPVQLAPYNCEKRVDVSMLWTLAAEDLGGGFRESLDGAGGSVEPVV
ncbi:hypothetical protein ACP70R_009807 [Stipagrostis hirtigluma subsp. patula]